MGKTKPKISKRPRSEVEPEHERKRKKTQKELVDEEEDEVLEREMMKKYSDNCRQSNPFNKSGEVSMIVYRMYLFSHRRAGDRYMYGLFGGENTFSLRNRTVVKPRIKGEPLSLNELERWWGKIDFGVERDKTFILSSSRRRVPFCRKSDTQVTYFCENLCGTVSTPHCEISRPGHAEDFIWIKDLNSEHGTFVNGKKLPAMTKYKLVDGDIVGLGIPHNCPDPRVDTRSRRFYIFKVKSLKKLADVDSEEEGNVDWPNTFNPVDAALTNVLVLDKILSFMKFKELKVMRLVDHFWKFRADLKLIPKSFVKFEYTYHPRVSNISGVKWSGVFQDKIDLIKKYGMHSMEVDITNNNPVSAPRQFYTDMCWLLSSLGTKIRELCLSMSVVNDRKGLEFRKVFSNLVNLETLDLSLDIHTGFYPILGSMTLPKVRHLALWIHDVEGEDELSQPLKNHIISEMAKLFPNLQGIMVKTGLLQNFLQYVHSNRNAWKDLTQVSAEFEIYGDNEDPVTSFNMIASVPQRIVKLQLDDIPPISPSAITAFENMLKKHAGTLEWLSLKFAETATDFEENEAHPALTLPSFPKLKNLQLVVLMDDDDEIQLQLRFPSGSICYEKDFPEIRNLSFTPVDPSSDSDSDYGPTNNVELMFNIFLPEDSETVCKTMRWVDFTLDNSVCTRDNIWYRGFLQRFQKIFPNVHHPEIARGLSIVGPRD